MSINAIYQHYEGTDLQCSGVQLNRELTCVNNIGENGTLRYLDCSGNVSYFQPISGYNDVSMVSSNGDVLVKTHKPLGQIDIDATWGGSIDIHASSAINLETDSGPINLTAENNGDVNIISLTNAITISGDWINLLTDCGNILLQSPESTFLQRRDNYSSLKLKRYNSTDLTDGGIISKISFLGQDSNADGAFPTSTEREWANIEVKNISWTTSHGVQFTINGWGLADDPDNKLEIMDAYWTGNKRIAFGSTHTDMYDNTGNWTDTPYSFQPWKLNENLFGCDGTFTTSKDAIFNRNIYVGNTIWGDQTLTAQTDCGNINIKASNYIYLSNNHLTNKTNTVMINDSRMPLSTVDISGDLRVGLNGSEHIYGLLTCEEYENTYYTRLHGGLGGIMVTADSGDIVIRTSDATHHNIEITASESNNGVVYISPSLSCAGTGSLGNIELTNATLGGGGPTGDTQANTLIVNVNGSAYKIGLYSTT